MTSPGPGDRPELHAGFTKLVGLRFGEVSGDRVVLTQIPSFGSVECLSFTTIADLDPAAAVYLEMDFRGDGQVEYRERIPSARWQPLTVLVNAPTWYDRVRLTLRKESAGHAVLARFEVARAEGCTGARVPLDNRPRGARCESGEQCAGGRCMTTCQ